MPELPEVEDPEERAFQRLYGPWRPWTPRRAAVALAGWGRPWWVAGGWAIEAFTSISRRHEDIDVAIFRRDVPSLRAHADPAYHCWAVGHWMWKALSADEPELPEWADQVWLREHAWAPWLADVVTTADADGDWVFRRDAGITAPLDEVTWEADGVRYLRPEIVLAFKAKLARLKDDQDLDAALPLLDEPAARWLRETVARLHPGHRWQPALDGRIG